MSTSRAPGKGGASRGAAVRDYWARQFQVIDARVEPTGFALVPHGRVVTDVHQVVRNPSGTVLSDHMVQHVYRLRDELVDHMEVRER